MVKKGRRQNSKIKHMVMIASRQKENCTFWKTFKTSRVHGVLERIVKKKIKSNKHHHHHNVNQSHTTIW